MAIFKGAETNPFNIGWNIVPEQSPDKDLSQEDSLVNLRKRSHQLIRDNPIVSGIQQTYINLITAQGPAIYSGSKNRIQRDQINKLLPELFKACDMSGTKSLYKILEEIISCSFADGDVLINLPLDKKRSGIKTVVELVEAHRIQTPEEYERDEVMSQRVRHGVQYDAEGRIEGYWVKKADKVDYSYRNNKDSFTFYPMYKEVDGYRRKVTFLFKAPLNSRPLASRQYPLVTPIIPFIKNLDDFTEATIIGARVAACFSAFVTAKNPNAAMKAMTIGPDGNAQTDPNASNRRYTKLQPGTIMYLNMNEEVNFAAPNRPGDNTDSFTLRAHKIISMTFRIPYILTFLDTEQVSYSSWRGAVLDTYRLVKRWRRDLNDVLDWIVSTWVLEGISLGLIRGSLSTIDLRKRWASSGVLDNEKEARGNKIELLNGTKSKQMICDEQGVDFEEVEADREEEALREVDLQAKILKKKKEYAEKEGIIFPDTVEAEEAKRDTSKSRREGEQEGEDLDEEDAKERRKEDGNW